MSLSKESARRSGVGGGQGRGGDVEAVDGWLAQRTAPTQDEVDEAAAQLAANRALRVYGQKVDRVLAREARAWHAREAQVSANSPTAPRQQIQEQDTSTSARTDRLTMVLDVARRLELELSSRDK